MMKSTKLFCSALWTAGPRLSSVRCYSVIAPCITTQCYEPMDIQSARKSIEGSLRACRRSHRALARSLHQRRHDSSTSANNSQSVGKQPEGTLSRTALYDLHVEKGAKMVPFAGYSMPVHYIDLSVGESHKWTRERASLFDVGHMYAIQCLYAKKLLMSLRRVQHHISGPGATAFLEMIAPISVASLAQNHSTLSCLLHPVTGGIVDDTVVTRLGPELFYLVTNAACKRKDLAYLEKQLQTRDTRHGNVDWVVRNDWGLVALQGPLSVGILEKTLQISGVEDLDLRSLYFGQCMTIDFKAPGITPGSVEGKILISRGGYTGEDGFEISLPPPLTVDFTRLLLGTAGTDRLRLAGLGARDSLRLEAGMCLYGHDLDDNTTPIEAGLSWVVHQNRRTEGGFHGHETILRQLKPAKEGGGVERRRVGLIVERVPAREGAEIVGPDDKVVGRVTSGCPSPTLGKNIAMGYVRNGLHKIGTELGVLVRGQRRKAEVAKMPFVASKYWKQAAGTSPG